MISGKTLQSSTFFAAARLAAMLTAAVVLFADAASADPRPGYPGKTTAGPTWADVRENALLRAGVKVGSVPKHTNPLMSSAALKVPCPVCSYRPPMLVRR